MRQFKRDRVFMFRLILAIPISLSTMLSSSQASESMILKAESVNKEYVIGEPIKITLTIENISQDTLRIIDAWEFTMLHCGNLFFEIRTPNGQTQYRQCLLADITSIIDYDNYLGDPLPPGGCLEIFHYPNTSDIVKGPGNSTLVGPTGISFPEAGTYEIRYIYYVSPRFKKLWKPQDGSLYSNSLTLTFREPTPVEKEILDAIWTPEKDYPYGYMLTMGDDVPVAAADGQALRNVIKKYPNHPFIRYAYFYLGKSELSLARRQNEDPDAIQAISIFESLKERYSDFRIEEILQHLGDAYARIGKRDKARQYFNEAIMRHPTLVQHYSFMITKVIAETGSKEAIRDWDKMRKSGSIFLKGSSL